jgi:hypothetical protein
LIYNTPLKLFHLNLNVIGLFIWAGRPSRICVHLFWLISFDRRWKLILKCNATIAVPYPSSLCLTKLAYFI